MIIMNGYYHFEVKVSELPNATTTNNSCAKIGARGEANSWSAKANIPGAVFRKEGAVGVLSDKFGFWYLMELKIEDGTISFLTTKEDSLERYSFAMKKKLGGEYWGEVSSLHLSTPSRRVLNCVITDTPTLFIPTYGVPDSMLVHHPPRRVVCINQWTPRNSRPKRATCLLQTIRIITKCF